MTTKISGANISSIGNTGLNWQAVTVADGSTQVNATSGNGYLLDTNAGVIEVFLPTSPTRGDTIVLAATGLRNLPCRAFNENAAWLEVVLSAVDLVAWTKKICFADDPALARCEIATFRYRVLHVAARITRGSRQVRLKIDKTWAWAAQIAEGFHRLRTAFG